MLIPIFVSLLAKCLLTSAQSPNKVAGADYCNSFEAHFRHYCQNSDNDEAKIYLNDEIRKSCLFYSQWCPQKVQGNVPASSHVFGVQKVWEFTGLTPGSSQSLVTCLDQCKDPQCLSNCECFWYKEPMERFCDPGQERPLMPSAKHNCIRWHQRCNVPFKAPQSDGIPDSDNSYLYKQQPYDHFQPIWYLQRGPHQVDWVTGQLGGADKWSLPSIGIEGTLNQWEVNFPSVSQLVGNVYPTGPPSTGKRRRRRRRMIFKFK